MDDHVCKNRPKFIIDVDTGVDDAQAIIMATSRKDIDIIGVTCVTGNVGIEQVCKNTLRVLKACSRLDIPVFKGAATPLIVEESLGHARHHHGKDGLGDVPDVAPPPPDLGLIQTEGAVEALLQLSHFHSGEITLVALAPLTNLALALKLDPDFGKRLKKVVIMGGNIEARGNVGPCAEFNFSSDPEAAYITLQELDCPIEIVSWETCNYNALSWEWFDRWRKIETPKAIFNFAITKNAVDRIRNLIKREKYVSCDPLAMAVAIDNSLIVESKKVHCTVELQGKHTRGQMVVDWCNKLQAPSNITLVTKTDVEKYGSQMETIFS